jgi:hypothetical protein
MKCVIFLNSKNFSKTFNALKEIIINYRKNNYLSRFNLPKKEKYKIFILRYYLFNTIK